MSLRARLFLMFAALAGLMMLAQGWWIRNLNRELSQELGSVAFAVANATASIFVDRDGECTDCPTASARLESPAAIQSAAFRAELDAKGLSRQELEAALARLRRQIPDPSSDKKGGSEDKEGLRKSSGEASPRQARPADPKTEEREDRRIYRARAKEVEQGNTAPGEGGEDGFHRTISYTFVTSSETIPPPGGAPTLEGGEIIHEERQVLVHANPKRDGEILFGFLDQPNGLHSIPVPRGGFEKALEAHSRHMMLGSLGIFGVGLLLAALLAHRITKPLGQLAEAATRVGEGKLGAQIPIQASGEMGRTIQAFNAMSSQVQALDAKARELSQRQHLGEIGEIARGLAHTLRNPLNALGLSVEELAARSSEDEDPDTDAETTALAGAARRQIRRIDGSIRSFLALASGGGGIVSPVDLAALTQDVALEILQDSRGRIDIEVRAEEDLPPREAVEAELRAVLQALLVNAVEASPEGARIRARLRRGEGSTLEVLIEDRGPGLAPEIRERLFTPHLTTKASGSGMGLFLAQRIASGRYGGGLELRERPGGGTQAVLCLGTRQDGGTHG